MELDGEMRHALALLSSLQKLKVDEAISDFTIEVGGESLLVHRTVLAACSEYFKAMLSHDTKESNEGLVTLRDVDVGAVKRCVEFMYTGKTKLTVDDVQDLLQASEMMQLHLLTDMCFQYLLDNLSVQSCLTVKQLGETFSREEVSAEAKAYVIRHFSSVLSTESYKKLSMESVLGYITAAKMKDDVTWRAITSCLENCDDEDSKEVDLIRALRTVPYPFKFGLMSVWKSPLVQNYQSCSDLMVGKLFSDLQVVNGNIDVDNCFDLKHLSTTFEHVNSGDILESVHSFMIKNLEEICTKDEFLTLDLEDICLFLEKSEVAYFSERAKWDIAVQWTKHEKGREGSFPDALKRIKRERLSPELVQHFLREEPFIESSLECCKLLLHGLVAGSRKTQSIAVMLRESGVMLRIEPATYEVDHLCNVKKGSFIMPQQLEGNLYVIIDKKMLCMGNDMTWTQKASLCRKPLQGSATAIFHGCIYVMEDSNLFKYDPSQDEWSETRHGKELGTMYAVAASESSIYVAGGEPMGNGAFRYYPEGKTWSSITFMKEKRLKAVSVAWRGVLHVLGGHWDQDVLRTVESFSEVTHQWTFSLPAMKVRRAGFAACVIGDCLYVVGGACEEDDFAPSKEGSLEVYDCRKGCWELSPPIGLLGINVEACILSLAP